MDADHLAENDMAVDRLTVEGLHRHDFDQLAFERAGAGGDNEMVRAIGAAVVFI
jgi:hypothetical protein